MILLNGKAAAELHGAAVAAARLRHQSRRYR
jgi:hypothetical protein